MSVSKTDALTYLAMLQFGGKSEIRTQGAVTPDSFQDCCLKPLGQLSIYGGRYRDRTYATFRLYTLAGCCITTLPTFLNLVPVPGLEPGCCTLVHRVSTYAGIIWWGKMELNHPSLLGNRFTVCPATSTVYSPEFGHHVRIRTLDTLLPKQVLYQTELRSVIR